MYKGYKVREIILNDYQVPETIIIIDASCGCIQCDEYGEIQQGHFACGLLPETLRGDKNIFPRLEHGEWFAEFIGGAEHVDEWIES